MVDLAPYPDASFDLVFSGQTIEHITEAEAEKMLSEVRRVLVPGGWFCLDTPNRRVTELQLGADVLSNPDHKLEYTHEHLSRLLRDGGFEIVGSLTASASRTVARGGACSTKAESRANTVSTPRSPTVTSWRYMCRTPRP